MTFKGAANFDNALRTDPYPEMWSGGRKALKSRRWRGVGLGRGIPLSSLWNGAL